MRGITAGSVVLLAAALLLTGACGGGDADEGSRPPTTAAATVPGATSPARTASLSPAFSVDSALLTLSDMPVGWAENPPDDDEPNEVCGFLVFDTAVEDADAEYSEGGSLPGLDHKVGRFEPGGAEAKFVAFDELLTTCREYKVDGRRINISRANLPSFGDQSVAFLLSTEAEGIRVAAYAVLIRVGDGLTGVTYTDIGTPSVDEAVRFARLATQKLRAAQG